MFRVAFGLVMVWSVAKYFWPQAGTNAIQFTYVQPAFLFGYPGFGWVQPWPEPLLSLWFASIGVAGLLVALGLWYRAASVWLFLSYTYVFLLEQARYNNHFYLMCLLAFLLICVPADRRFSIDAWRRSRRSDNDSSNSILVPFWPIFLIRAQLFAMYFYGGIAKINADWLTGVPLLGPGGNVHGFLTRQVGVPDTFTVNQVCLLLAWGGLVYDLAIGFLLLIRRTRAMAVLLTLAFHLHNQFIFPIGVFPTLAFAATLIFLEPDWPVRFWSWLRRPRWSRPNWRWFLAGALIVPGFGAALGWKGRRCETGPTNRRARLSRPALLFVCGWIAVQVLVPLRHNLIPGDANWTEEGQNFSWRMMLRSKATGHILFHVTDPELHVTADNGRQNIDWRHWPEDRPRAVYVPVDCHRFR